MPDASRLFIVTASLRRLVMLIFALGTLVAADTATADTLVEEIYRERQKNDGVQVDVAHVAAVHIHVGAEVASAKRILEANKFKTYEVEKKDGSYSLLGTQKRRTLLRFLPFLEDEYRIVLRIKDGKVESVWAKVFLQAL